VKRVRKLILDRERGLGIINKKIRVGFD